MKNLTPQEKSDILENNSNFLYKNYVFEKMSIADDELYVGLDENDNSKYELNLKGGTSYYNKGYKFTIDASRSLNAVAFKLLLEGKKRELKEEVGEVLFIRKVFLDCKEVYKSLDEGNKREITFDIELAKKADSHRPLANALNDFITDFNKVMQEFGRSDLEIMNLREFQKFIGFKPMKEISKENGLRKAIQEL